MMDLGTFNSIKERYGLYASWAIWSNVGDKPKSNIGDLSMFDLRKNPTLLEQLKPHVILVGLNISRGLIKESFANFHDSRPQGTDFKIRHALQGSDYWGAYMTDLFKDLDEKDSNKVKALIKNDPSLIAAHVTFLRDEIRHVVGESSARATLIAFGDVVYTHLKNNFSTECEVKKIPHYASQNYNNKDLYKKAVWQSLMMGASSE